MDSIIREEHFHTAQEWINFVVKRENFVVKSYWDTADALPSRFLYRGQKCSKFKLESSAFRDSDWFEKHTPQPPKLEHKDYLASHIKAEDYAVFRFMEYADSVGLMTPLDYQTINVHTEILYKAFNDDNYDFSDPFPDARMLSAYAFAQHHGVKTRLLDWSESPLVAGYFAAEEHVFTINGQSKPEHFSIYALDLNSIRSCTSLSIIKAPRATNHFLREQKGIFTLIRDANHFYKKNSRWPTIEDKLLEYLGDHNGTPQSKPLLQMTLPTSEAANLLKILYKFDISRLTLKPSLANAATDFEYRKLLFPRD